MMDWHQLCSTIIKSRCIYGRIYTRKIKDSRITKDVRKKRRRHKQKEVILHCGFKLRFLVILIVNESAGWLCKTNSVDVLILIHNNCRVWNGRTQDSIIRRIIQVRRWRLWYKMYMTTRWTHNQICAKIKRSDVGWMWQSNRCVCMFSHITLQWWSCLMRGRQIVTCDSDHVYLWLCKSITKECLVRLELKILLGMRIFLKAVLELVPKIEKNHLALQSLKLQITEVLPKSHKRFM